MKSINTNKIQTFKNMRPIYMVTFNASTTATTGLSQNHTPNLGKSFESLKTHTVEVTYELVTAQNSKI